MIKTNLKSQSSCNNFDLNNYLINNDLGASLDISASSEENSVTIALINKQGKVLNDVTFEVIQDTNDAIKSIGLDEDNITLRIKFQDEAKEDLTCDLSKVLQTFLIKSDTLNVTREGSIVRVEVPSNTYVTSERFNEFASSVDVRISNEAVRALAAENELSNRITKLEGSVDDLSKLETKAKDTLVNAINEVNTKVNQFQYTEVDIKK